MMVKLIAIDMDGTLLDSQKKISQDNITAIQAAAKAGIKIVICTGRPMSGIVPYFEQLGLDHEEYIIMNNGCSIYRTKDWQLLHSEQLTLDEIIELQKASAPYPEVCLTLTGERSYYAMADAVPELVQYDAGLVFTKAKAVDLEQLKTDGEVIFQAMYMAQPQVMDQFQEAVDSDLSQTYSTVRSQDYIYEVLPKGATKASGLSHLADKLGIEASQIMALGDAANDLEMLQFAGVSVAMGNASDDIKQHCLHVTTSNDEAGVAKAIYDYALKG